MNWLKKHQLADRHHHSAPAEWPTPDPVVIESACEPVANCQLSKTPLGDPLRRRCYCRDVPMARRTSTYPTTDQLRCDIHLPRPCTGTHFITRASCSTMRLFWRTHRRPPTVTFADLNVYPGKHCDNLFTMDKASIGTKTHESLGRFSLPRNISSPTRKARRTCSTDPPHR